MKLVVKFVKKWKMWSSVLLPPQLRMGEYTVYISQRWPLSLTIPKNINIWWSPWKKVRKNKWKQICDSQDCYDPDETLAEDKDCLSETTGVISKLIGAKFRKLPGNMNYSTLWSEETKLYNIRRGGRKIKLFSARSGFTGQIFIRELNGVDSSGGLRQGVNAFFHVTIWLPPHNKRKMKVLYEMSFKMSPSEKLLKKHGTVFFHEPIRF